MACALRFNQFGPLTSVLSVQSIPKPSLAPGCSLIRIKASAINPSDCKNVEGYFPITSVPRTPGRDFAGVVVDGPGDQVGKRVWGTGGTHGYEKDGTHAQYILIYPPSLWYLHHVFLMTHRAGI